MVSAVRGKRHFRTRKPPIRFNDPSDSTLHWQGRGKADRDPVDPQTETETDRCNFIISMRTGGRLLNNSTLPLSRPTAANFIDIN